MNKLAVSVEDIKRERHGRSSPPPSPRAGSSGSASWKHSGCPKLCPRDATAHELAHAKAQKNHKFSQTLAAVFCYSKHTRPLTFESWQPARMCC